MRSLSYGQICIEVKLKKGVPMVKKAQILLSTLMSLFVICLGNAFSDTVILKSGKEIQGKIVEETEDYVKIEIGGVPVTYLSDEIEKIEKDSDASKHNKADTDNYNSALNNQVNNIVYFLLNKQYENAADLSKKLVGLYPLEDAGYELLALSCYYLGKVSEAKEYAEKAININMDRADLYILLGLACDDLGLSSEAKINLEKAAILSQKNKKLTKLLLIENVLKRIK